MSAMVGTATNPTFTFASMVVPSNDFFIGNDSPTEYKLFIIGGRQVQIDSITIKANEMSDAGLEVDDPSAAAFVGNNGLRTSQRSVVAFHLAPQPVRDFLAGAPLPLRNTDPMAGNEPRVFSATRFSPQPGQAEPPGNLCIVLDGGTAALVAGIDGRLTLLAGALMLRGRSRPLQRLARRLPDHNLRQPNALGSPRPASP